ncbi:MAG: nuclear transport factor 2 family protein [Acidobacteriota bacterium]
MSKGTPEELVRRLNETWLAGDLVELAACFDSAAVLLPPGGGEAIVGRDGIIDGYRQYLAAATTHEFEVRSVETFSFGETAVVHLRFEVEYSFGEERSRESGLEIYVLRRDDAGWRVVWRAQKPLPGDAEGGEA